MIKIILFEFYAARVTTQYVAKSGPCEAIYTGPMPLDDSKNYVPPSSRTAASGCLDSRMISRFSLSAAKSSLQPGAAYM